MAQKLGREMMAAQADVHAAMPVAAQMHEVDRTFELPAVLYAGTVVCYLAYLGITAAAFASPGLILPMGFLVVFMAIGFGLPTVWARMDPAKLAPSSTIGAKSWTRFQRDGIKTLTGHNTAGEATVQVLILPVLIVA